MTDNEIIELAQTHKLGRRLRPISRWPTGDVFYTDASYRTSELIDFAKAIAASEREACARECGLTADDLRHQGEGAHDGHYEWMADGAMQCADAIRARSTE